jgi:hypothetical protein
MTLSNSISGALDGFGGYLRCETCRRCEPLGNPGRRVTGEGWPKCCGYTMRWWTQRQIDAGEVPK